MTSLTDGQVEHKPAAKQLRLSWARCLEDIAPFVTRHVTWRALAASDIKSKYRRTMLGPWWITVTNGLSALIMGVVAGRFLGSDMRTYLPHFMISMTIWNFISSSLGESCYTMISAGGMIKAVNMPLLIHIMRMAQRNLIIFLHNIAIIPLIWLIYPWHVSFVSLLSIFGLMLIYVFIVGASLIISMICVRYRDVPPVMQAVLQLLFFVSPIIWDPAQIKRGTLFVALNPIAHLLAITRDPLMGIVPSWTSWVAALGFVAILTAAMIFIYTRYRARVVYWA